jgi:hypothetical protein
MNDIYVHAYRLKTLTIKSAGFSFRHGQGLLSRCRDAAGSSTADVISRRAQCGLLLRILKVYRKRIHSGYIQYTYRGFYISRHIAISSQDFAPTGDYNWRLESICAVLDTCCVLQRSAGLRKKCVECLYIICINTEC